MAGMQATFGCSVVFVVEDQEGFVTSWYLVVVEG